MPFIRMLMENLLLDLWWTFKHGRGWREVRRSRAHPRLGEMQYVGRRSRPGGHVSGYWKVQPSGFDTPVGVDFPSEGNEPTVEGLAKLEELLGDPDGLFERSRLKVREAYELTVEEPMPDQWRAAFRLDHITLPDPEDPDLEWQVTYWCEAAQHWFVVDFFGEAVTDVRMEG